jgi:hypothetical protein
MSTILAIVSGWETALFLPRGFVKGSWSVRRDFAPSPYAPAAIVKSRASDAKTIIYDSRGSAPTCAGEPAQEGMDPHMTRLRRYAIVAIAVVLAVALVAYMLRPTATPTTASTTSQPPANDPCASHSRGLEELSCGTPAAPGGGGPSGSDKDPKGDHDSDDHDGHGHDGHDYGKGHDDRDDQSHSGKHGHYDRGVERGDD